ncbi:MAG: hypothetical protein QXL17_02885 [Candidatus Thermoplasmatota archaeon]
MTIIIRTHVRSYAKKRPAQQGKFKTLQVFDLTPPRAGSDTKNIPSLGDGIGVALRKESHTTEKQYVIAPICNKGAYQVITNPDDMKTMGRKV